MSRGTSRRRRPLAFCALALLISVVALGVVPSTATASADIPVDPEASVTYQQNHVRRASRLCVSVRAEDIFGNWSSWSSTQCVVRRTARH
jgi:hypothetical protein